MALNLEWADGFDLVTYSNTSLKYRQTTGFHFGTMQPPLGSVPGPDGIGEAWEVGNTGLGGSLFAGSPVFGARDTWIVNLSVQFKPNGDRWPADPTKFFYPETYFLWGAPAGTSATPHTVKLLTVADASEPYRVRLQLWAGGDGSNPFPSSDAHHVVLWTSSYLVDHSHRYWFQLKFQQSTGLLELWIDGALAYSVTNPVLFSGTSMDYWALFHQHYTSFGNSGPSFDDWAVFSTTDPTTALPLPMRVYSVLMGTDVSKVWTPSTAPDNFKMIYDHPVLDPVTEEDPDFDSTFVHSAGAVSAETYKTGEMIWDTSNAPTFPVIYLPEVPSFTKVYGVALNATLKGEGPLAAFLRGFVNGSDVPGTDTRGHDIVAGNSLLANPYLTNQYQSMTNPLTGLPWLGSSIRAANWGVRQTSGDDARMTAFYLEIVGLIGPEPPPTGAAYIRGSGGFALAA